MSRKLKVGERSRDLLPLSQVTREFIDSHARKGATPGVIASILNSLVTRSPEEIRAIAPRPYGQIRSNPGRTWERLSGERTITAREARREIDRLRKSPGEFDRDRKYSLQGFKNGDAERAAVRNALPAELRLKNEYPGTSRTRHDLALARRFGMTAVGLDELARELHTTVPKYLQVA